MDYFEPTGKPTTLTIVQEFPKKKNEEMASPEMEFVQGQEQHVEYSTSLKNSKGTTLTIVQDFPKR